MVFWTCLIAVMTLPKRRLYSVEVKTVAGGGAGAGAGAGETEGTEGTEGTAGPASNVTALLVQHPAFPRILAALLSGGDVDRIGVKWVHENVVASGYDPKNAQVLPSIVLWFAFSPSVGFVGVVPLGFSLVSLRALG